MPNETTVVTSNRKFKTLVTDIGNIKSANAVLNGKKVNIVTAVIGDGNGAYYAPTSDQTAVLREVWRGEIANKAINEKSANMYDVRIVLDGNVGGFTVREVGLLDDEGDLIVIANTPDTPKAVLEDGILAPLTIVLHVVFANTEVIQFKVNPSVDSVDYETMQTEFKKHDADCNAHANLMKAMGLPVTIGGTEPTSGPALWFNTGAIPKPTPIVFLDLKGDSDESNVRAEISGKDYSLMNASLDNTNTDQFHVNIT